MTPEQGLLELEQARQVETQYGWKFIRLLIALVDEYGPEYYYKAADHLGCQPRSLMNDASLGRNPASHYAEQLHLTRYHMEQVTGMMQDEAESWLLYAAENGLPARTLAHAIKQQESPRGEANPTGSAQSHATDTKVQTRQPTPQSATAPALYSQEAASHTLAGEDYDVPFAEPFFAGIEEPVQPFEVAEYIMNRWGKAFAVEVVTELERWW